MDHAGVPSLQQIAGCQSDGERKGGRACEPSGRMGGRPVNKLALCEIESAVARWSYHTYAAHAHGSAVPSTTWTH